MSLSFASTALYAGLTDARRTAAKAQVAKRGDVKAEAAYFRAAVAKMKTPEDFFKNYRALKFAMTAFDMGTQMQYPARLKQIMMSDPTDPLSLVNRMTDPAYRTINNSFKLYNGTLDRLQDPTFINKVVEKYTNATYEQGLGDMNPALTDALYFERTIGTVKNGYQIISDPILFRVVKTANNLPDAVAGGSKVEALKTWVEKNFSLSKANDAAYVKKYITRYLALSDMKDQQGANGGNALVGMFA